MDRPIIAVALAALLVLAGCSALQPGGDGAGAPTTEEPPDWVGQNDSLSDTIVTESRLTLGNATNFTIAATSNSTLLTPQRLPRTWRSNQSRTVELDRAGQTLYLTRVIDQRGSDPVSEERFIRNGTRYQRTDSGGNATYGSGAPMASFAQYAEIYSNVSRYLAPYNLSYAGTTTHGGETVHVVRGDADNVSMSALDEVTNATARAYLTDSARAIRIEQTYEGTVNSSSSLPAEVRIDVAFEVSAIGSTDVTTPDWLSRFPNATANVAGPRAPVAP